MTREQFGRCWVPARRIRTRTAYSSKARPTSDKVPLDELVRRCGLRLVDGKVTPP